MYLTVNIINKNLQTSEQPLTMTAAFGKVIKGSDGISPHIGNNGNWWIGDQDTGVTVSSDGDYNNLSNLPTYNGQPLKGAMLDEFSSKEYVDNSIRSAINELWGGSY